MLMHFHRFKRVGPNAMRGRGIGTARGRATIMRGASFWLCDINGDNSFYLHSIRFCLFVSSLIISSKWYADFFFVHGLSMACPWLALPSELSDKRFFPCSSTWSWCRATSKGNSTLIIFAGRRDSGIVRQDYSYCYSSAFRWA